MPTTTFRLLPAGKRLISDTDAFQRMLPESMKFERKEDTDYLKVQTEIEEDERAKFMVTRELDRLFLLTCVRVEAEMCTRIQNVSLSTAWRIQGPIPPGTARPAWTYELGLQLRLWALASEAPDLLSKIVFLYQIIELSHPTFPRYMTAKQAPDPLTECKFLRHLVTHAGNVENKELKRYCDYLGLPAVMLDRSDPAYVDLLNSRLPILEAEAREIIRNSLQSGPARADAVAIESL